MMKCEDSIRQIGDPECAEPDEIGLKSFGCCDSLRLMEESSLKWMHWDSDKHELYIFRFDIRIYNHLKTIPFYTKFRSNRI